MNKTYAYNHNPIHFNFAQTIERFFVEEIIAEIKYIF